MEKDDTREELKKKFTELFKAIKDPQEESGYDLGITYKEDDSLTYEEEQEIDEMAEKMIEDLADKLTDLEEE